MDIRYEVVKVWVVLQSAPQTAEVCSLLGIPASFLLSCELWKSLMDGKPTLCSTHWATHRSFLSSRAGPMSCKPMGRPRCDKAVGTVTAGRPVFKQMENCIRSHLISQFDCCVLNAFQKPTDIYGYYYCRITRVQADATGRTWTTALESCSRLAVKLRPVSHCTPEQVLIWNNILLLCECIFILLESEPLLPSCLLKLLTPGVLA